MAIYAVAWHYIPLRTLHQSAKQPAGLVKGIECCRKKKSCLTYQNELGLKRKRKLDSKTAEPDEKPLAGKWFFLFE